MDDRLIALEKWLQARLAGTAFTLEPASEDASFRRYFRITTREQSLIAMDAPPDKEDSAPFVKVAGLLGRCGINVPQVVEADLSLGFLLLTDLGDQPYLPALQSVADARPLYEDALRALVRFQVAADASGLPDFDRQFLDTEMGLFRDWLLVRHLGVELGAGEAAQLQESFDYLSDAALAQPVRFVHRDFHSRNLMVCAGNNPGVLDFQDAMRGPVTYDLVSLLKDCYISLRPEQVSAYVDFYLREAQSAGVDVGADRNGFFVNFELMGVQRHLKASGIFARLWHRDGKRGYLADIPRTLAHISRCADSYPELGFLAELIRHRVVPALQAGRAEGL